MYSSDKQGRFYFVWSPQGSTPPAATHAGLPEAPGEAKRLAKQHPGQQFYVVKAMVRVEVDPCPVKVTAL